MLTTHVERATAQVRMTLVQHWFPELNESEQIKTANDFIQRGQGLGVKPSCLLQVLQALDSEADPDMKQFQKMKEDLEDSLREDILVGRCGRGKAAAMTWTPEVIKLLRPQVESGTRSRVLVWQPSTKAFEGYYPASDTQPRKRQRTKGADKEYHTVSRSYGGKKHTMLSALQKTVNELWLFHKKAGGDSFWSFSVQSLWSVLLLLHSHF
jgi:hypothetical protein